MVHWKPTQPDPSPVVELIEAFRRSKVTFAAVALGLFDNLNGGPSPQRIFQTVPIRNSPCNSSHNLVSSAVPTTPG